MATVQLVKRVSVDGERAYKAADTPGEGVFYLTWYEKQGGKLSRRREALRDGLTVKQATKERDERQKTLDAIAQLKLTGQYKEPAKKDGRLTLMAATSKYLAFVNDFKAKKTYSSYSTALEYFLESCGKTYVDEVNSDDMLAYRKHIVSRHDQSPRSVSNKFLYVMAFLKYSGRSAKDVGVTKEQRPTYAQSKPEIYTDAQLTRLFAACTPEELRWFKFFESTGMREGEVMHCQWSWVDLEQDIITVQPNERLNWEPKKKKSRDIPIPPALRKMLVEWKKKSDVSDSPNPYDLVFPTSGGKPKLDFLDCLKSIAKQAGLYCGKCEGCGQKPQNCGGIFLHKFRATYATRLLRGTVDLSTVMEYLGHDDLASTQRYLRAAEGKEARAKVAAIFV